VITARILLSQLTRVGQHAICAVSLRDHENAPVPPVP
jgi:hypothetical protein